MGGNDGRPSRGLALRARGPALELGRRWWQWRRGRTHEREEAVSYAQLQVLFI